MSTTNAEVEDFLDSEMAIGKSVDPKKLNLREETLMVNRVSKVVKGGRRFSFASLVAVGDGNGHVGLGFGKANEVPDAINKATERAKKNLIRVPLMGRTIPHQVIGVHDSARVLLKPASEGTGLIAGASVRAYLSLAGIHDILAKSLGSDNKLNVIKAAYEGLKQLKRVDEIARLRGKKIEDLIGVKGKSIYQKSKASTLAAEYPELARKREAAEKAKAESEKVLERKLEETEPSPTPQAEATEQAVQTPIETTTGTLPNAEPDAAEKKPDSGEPAAGK